MSQQSRDSRSRVAEWAELVGASVPDAGSDDAESRLVGDATGDRAE
jgi:hypothetical protein